MKKKILFLTGTRADFGKIKSLILAVEKCENFEVGIFVTGMHTLTRYGYTVDEVYQTLPEHRLRDGTRSVYVFHNQISGESMERVLSSTIEGLSRYVNEFTPDLLVVHGDRVEALAGAIVGALRNILVAHIEGGEVSGTIDELIRHAVTKMSHTHFVANKTASRRLLQLGEDPSSVHIIGSPDIDIMNSNKLPSIDNVKSYYNIPFRDYGIVLFHPITTDLKETREASIAISEAVIASEQNHVIIFPNNDEGCEIIFNAWNHFEDNSRLRILPSMRVEYFLVLLKNSRYLLGNSSAGIRECPVYGIPALNVTSRQSGRARSNCVIQVPSTTSDILKSMRSIWDSNCSFEPDYSFGTGESSSLFLKCISDLSFWDTPKQKRFIDI